jgi:hypothetical protein
VRSTQGLGTLSLVLGLSRLNLEGVGELQRAEQAGGRALGRSCGRCRRFRSAWGLLVAVLCINNRR